MKVAVLGATGQLGTDVVREFLRADYEVAGLAHTDLDVGSLESTRAALDSVAPAIIVNTAAMHHVEKCECEPNRAYEVNAVGVRNLAIVARELGAKLVHISTDYVFDGLKECPYLESDAAAPLNIYGNTKLAGEAFLHGLGKKYFIVRTSALYGKNPCRAKGGRNFVELMMKLASEGEELRVVNDEVVSPTPTAELARQIVVLSRTENYGLYHATAEDSCSWYEFAKAIFEITNTKANLNVANPGEFLAKVPRPKYSVLENAALKKLGLNVFQPWKVGLMNYLAGSNSRSALAGYAVAQD